MNLLIYCNRYRYRFKWKWISELHNVIDVNVNKVFAYFSENVGVNVEVNINLDQNEGLNLGIDAVVDVGADVNVNWGIGLDIIVDVEIKGTRKCGNRCVNNQQQITNRL